MRPSNDLVLGIGGLVSILVSRRVRARGWIALGLRVAVAIAVPAVRTDWDGWRALRSFGAAAAPGGWEAACTLATIWQDEHGVRVGESFQRDYFVFDHTRLPIGRRSSSTTSGSCRARTAPSPSAVTC
jgi:hypothetical protein